jgi:CheY-like chemotaxis protein
VKSGPSLRKDSSRPKTARRPRTTQMSIGPQRLRVFVVEDHEPTARGLQMLLQLAGYTVDIATTVASATRFADGNKFDVLLCDLNLPDGNGWDLMEFLSAGKPVPAVAFSAYDEPEQIARSKAVGFAEHVIKGADPEALIAAIKRVTGSRASAAARTASER